MWSFTGTSVQDTNFKLHLVVLQNFRGKRLPGITTFFFGDAHSYEVKGVKSVKSGLTLLRARRMNPRTETESAK